MPAYRSTCRKIGKGRPGVSGAALQQNQLKKRPSGGLGKFTEQFLGIDDDRFEDGIISILP